MDPLVHGRAADVDPDRPGRRRQLDEVAREAVVQAHSAIVLRRPTVMIARPGRSLRSGLLAETARPARARASSRGTAASTAQSSGPFAAPVNASRSERRSPPTAFSSRRTTRDSSAERCPGPTALNSAKRSSVGRASAGSSTGSGSTTMRAYSRASTSDRAPRNADTASIGAPACAASSSSPMPAIASIASRRSRARSSWTSCSGVPSSSR